MTISHAASDTVAGPGIVVVVVVVVVGVSGGEVVAGRGAVDDETAPGVLEVEDEAGAEPATLPPPSSPLVIMNTMATAAMATTMIPASIHIPVFRGAD